MSQPLPLAEAKTRQLNRQQRRRAAKRAKTAEASTKKHIAGAPTKPQVRSVLTAAVGHHKAGEIDQAEALYRRTLEIDPNEANALRLLGTILNAKGEKDSSGIPCIITPSVP